MTTIKFTRLMDGKGWVEGDLATGALDKADRFCAAGNEIHPESLGMFTGNCDKNSTEIPPTNQTFYKKWNGKDSIRVSAKPKYLEKT